MPDKDWDRGRVKASVHGGGDRTVGQIFRAAERNKNFRAFIAKDVAVLVDARDLKSRALIASGFTVRSFA
jgi:hypothetical protein